MLFFEKQMKKVDKILAILQNDLKTTTSPASKREPETIDTSNKTTAGHPTKVVHLTSEDEFDDDFFNQKMPSFDDTEDTEAVSIWTNENTTAIISVAIFLALLTTASIILIVWCSVRNCWCCIIQRNNRKKEIDVEGALDTTDKEPG